LEFVKECVITHLPNELALKMDVAKQPADTLLFWFMTSEQVEGREGRAEGFVWTRLERPLVQILVVVATIQMTTLKTEVEKGFMRTAFGHE